ncbi:MAG TPA: D-glycero-beta-D-manno-heptose-7-phosphate kinase [Alphaproteobacteria bacterium]|nr:D-glycero-beta-D-manno-heptose-7-phosphate kinase [Alphaproteobacteria bacterium]
MPSAPSSLSALVETMSGRAVLVVGDLMLDRFVSGVVERISPESPVPVLSIRRESRMLGGAGNVVSNLHGLKIRPILVSVTGADEDGAAVRALAEGLGADCAGLAVDPTRPTTVKTRFLAGHQQLLRTDFEQIAPLSPALAAQLLEHVHTALPAVRAVVFSDYGKGVLTDEVLAESIAAARSRGLPVLIDPKGRDYGRYRGASVVTPNRKELVEASGGKPLPDDESLVAAAHRVCLEAGVESMVATRAAEGMTVVQGKPGGGGFERPLHLRAQAREVYDVSGAGDTVIATLAAALAAGAALPQAAHLANLAGGIVVGKVGTAAIRAQDLVRALENAAPSDRADDRADSERVRIAPVLALEAAAEQVRLWQSRGLKVGFTNGCFDILHPGHVGLLAAARERCDRLVVALNHDASVRRLKGPTRPVNTHADRAQVIGGLGSVDLVVFFGENPAEDDKPLDIIRSLRPDILFKGGDYTESTVVGADFVRRCGGEVCLLPFAEGHSTTAIIGRMGQ